MAVATVCIPSGKGIWFGTIFAVPCAWNVTTCDHRDKDVAPGRVGGADPKSRPLSNGPVFRTLATANGQTNAERRPPVYVAFNLNLTAVSRYDPVHDGQAQSRAVLIPAGGLIEAMSTVIQRVEETPVTLTVGENEVLFDADSIKLLSRGYTGGLPAWPADVITLFNGDFSEAAERAVRRYRNSGRSFRTASYLMLDCGSGITANRLAEYNSDPALKILGRMNWGYTAGCPIWGSNLGDEFRQNFETSIPTVIMHGTWDTSTPYENALELVPYFKNSKFITVIRGPHGAIQAAMRVSEEFRAGIMSFAATGDTSQLPDEVEMPKANWVVPSAK